MERIFLEKTPATLQRRAATQLGGNTKLPPNFTNFYHLCKKAETMNRNKFKQLLEKEERTFTFNPHGVSDDFAYLTKDAVLKIYDEHFESAPKYQHIQQLCPKCNGEGQIGGTEPTNTSRLCPVCSGTMTVVSTIHF